MIRLIWILSKIWICCITSSRFGFISKQSGLLGNSWMIQQFIAQFYLYKEATIELPVPRPLKPFTKGSGRQRKC